VAELTAVSAKKHIPRAGDSVDAQVATAAVLAEVHVGGESVTEWVS
jgi:hypothetical protein